MNAEKIEWMRRIRYVAFTALGNLNGNRQCLVNGFMTRQIAADAAGQCIWAPSVFGKQCPPSPNNDQFVLLAGVTGSWPLAPSSASACCFSCYLTIAGKAGMNVEMLLWGFDIGRQLQSQQVGSMIRPELTRVCLGRPLVKVAAGLAGSAVLCTAFIPRIIGGMPWVMAG